MADSSYGRADDQRGILERSIRVRLPQTGSEGAYLKQQLRDKLVEYGRHIRRHGQDILEIRDWVWPGSDLN